MPILKSWDEDIRITKIPIQIPISEVAEPQICFPSKDGLLTICNWVKRGDKAIMSDHGWMKIPRIMKLVKRRKIIKDPTKGVSDSNSGELAKINFNP